MGQEIGLDIVDDDEVEEEISMTEDDKEVNNIFLSNKAKHEKLLKGT